MPMPYNSTKNSNYDVAKTLCARTQHLRPCTVEVSLGRAGAPECAIIVYSNYYFY